MKAVTVILLFFYISAFLSDALSLEDSMKIIHSQLQRIHEAAQSADTIEELNELIWDHRVFDKNNADIVQRTKETLGQAVLGLNTTWVRVGFIEALVYVKLGDLPLANDLLEVKVSLTSSTGYVVTEAIPMRYEFNRIRGACDLKCIYKRIFI